MWTVYDRSAGKHPTELGRDPLRPVSQLALPDDEDTPTEDLEFLQSCLITRRVASKLLGPEAAVLFRQPRPSAAPMLVPIAAMDKNRDFAADEGDVRTSWHVAAMQPIPGMTDVTKHLAHLQLGARVFALDPAHEP